MNIQREVLRKTGLTINDCELGLPLKTEIQDAIGRLEDRFIILELCTGLGKSRAGLLHCQDKDILILCKQVSHFDTFIGENGELKKWNICPKSVETYCYNSLHKLAGRRFDVILMDECHALSEARLKALKQLRCGKLIALSGTIPDEVYARLYSLGKAKTIKIPTELGIKWKLVPAPKIYLIERKLNNTNVNQTFELYKRNGFPEITIGYRESDKYWPLPYNLKIRCTEQEYYKLLDRQFNDKKELFFKYKQELSLKRKQLIDDLFSKSVDRSATGYSRVVEKVDGKKDKDGKTIKPGVLAKDYSALAYHEIEYYRYGGMRKEYLAQIKTDTAIKWCNKLKDERIVVFANSIEQCNTLADSYPVVHSKSTDKKQIDKFNSLEYNKLFSVMKINESMNLIGAIKALLVQLAGSKIPNKQRFGRVLRHPDSELYIIYTPFTQDDNYLKYFKKGLKLEYFEYKTIDEV